jgi:hypothetical protein
MGKSHLHPYISDGFERAKRRAQGFHSDIRGPFSTPTPSGHLYFCSIVDDFSRRVFPFLIKTQDEWIAIWKKFVAMVEAELGKPNCIAWIYTDNGSVYTSAEMASFCAEKGIQQRFSAPYSQWMNHAAERNMRTIGEMTVTTMIHANMPKRAWGWATMLACEVINRTTEKAAGTDQKLAPSPHASRLERWKGTCLPTQTKALYPFGCLAFKHIPATLRNKLDAHAVPMVYLGVDAQSRSFLLGTLYEMHTSVCVEVTFFENVFPFRKHRSEESPASLLWGAETSLAPGDPRLGMFDTDTNSAPAPIDKNTLKAIGVQPNANSKAYPSKHVPLTSNPYNLRSKVRTSENSKEPPVAPHNAISDNSTLQREKEADSPPDDYQQSAARPQDVWQPYSSPVASNRLADVRSVWEKGLHHITESALTYIEGDTSIPSPCQISEAPEVILQTITEASLQNITPRNAFEAVRSPLKRMWMLAMEREKLCHLKNGTFGSEMRTPPRVAPDAKPIPADWVFKIKYRGGPIHISQLTEKQFKARVVIRGQFMKEGINFNDTFAPVAKPATVRAFLASAAANGRTIKAGDVETAFLSADMDCEVWVRMPPFWGGADNSIDLTATTGPPRLLKKGVPGIPQGSRLFYETFSSHLSTMGFKQSHADKCLFFKNAGPDRLVVLLWVDDFLVSHVTDEAFEGFMRQLRSKFTVTSVGPLTSFLGMEICYSISDRSISICQSNTIGVLLERSKMTECNPSSTPCPAGTVFTKKDSPPDAGANTTATEYRSLIALANFLSCWTRPDITFTVNKLCKYMANPGDAHWKLLKHLIRYLKGTKNLALKYAFSSSEGSTINGYSDSSFADCIDSGRSTMAYTFFYGSALLSWYSKLGSYVTTCTNHSEYNALALASKEAEWLLLLFSQLHPDNEYKPLPIYVDNSGIVSMVFNPIDHQSNKHVRISCHYTRELYENKIIIPVRVPTEANIADMFTKPLPVLKFNAFVSKLLSKRTETVLMITAQDNDEQHSDPEDVESKRPLSEFETNWPFPSVIKHSLGASSYEIAKTGDTFTTGREKLEAIFFRLNELGRKVEVSRHEAMELTNKNGRNYVVCRRTPKIPEQATIRIVSPTPTLTCSLCHAINTPMFALLQCRSCSGMNFTWSCGCVVRAQTETPSNPSFANVTSPPRATSTTTSTSVTPATRKTPRRSLGKTWTEQIKYVGPIGRTTLYHILDCRVMKDVSEYQIASIEFANAYGMKPAPCCSST